jgi:hypothetical protein
MRYSSKEQLLDDVRKEYRTLCATLEAIPRSRYREAGVWGDAWTLHDLVAHLAAWHRLFLGWYAEGLRGGTPHLPAEGFKWSELARLNRAIQAEHRDRPIDVVWAELETSHAEIVTILERASEAELLEPGAFAWTRDHGLVTYLAGNTSSHYRFASKVLRRWSKGVAVPARGAGREAR